MPFKAMTCGLPEAVSATETLPARDPDAVGVNVTEIVQLPDAATDPPQLLV